MPVRTTDSYDPRGDADVPRFLLGKTEVTGVVAGSRIPGEWLNSEAVVFSLHTGRHHPCPKALLTKRIAELYH